MRLVGLSPHDELLDAVAKAGGVRNLESPLWPFLPVWKSKFTARSSSTPSTRAPDAPVDFHTVVHELTIARVAGHEERRRARAGFLVRRAVSPANHTERCVFVLDDALARLDGSLQSRVLE